MAKRTWSRGVVVAVVAVLAAGSFGCTTLRRAGSPTSTEEVDMLADVELTEQEAADAAPAEPSKAGPTGARSVDVAWTPSGKHIQLAKLPPVKPVTASMLSLGKRPGGPDGSAPPRAARGDASRLESEAPPRGLAKSDLSKGDAAKP